jgi:hypothetical protein
VSGNGYRSAEFIWRDDTGRIRLAASEMCHALGLEDETYFEQAECFAAALILMHERNEEVHDAWRAVGYLGQLLALHGKATRLMNNLWWHKSKGRSENPLDNAVDALNYAAFFMRCWLAGDERGKQEERNDDTPNTE